MKTAFILAIWFSLLAIITTAGIFTSLSDKEQYETEKLIIQADYDSVEKKASYYEIELKNKEQNISIFEVITNIRDFNQELAKREQIIEDCKSMKVMTKECQDLITEYGAKYIK